jgi:3-hydroxy-9,10-secoandrosta-1,3,5(10)-triene-9,17-dione monooxygenase
MSERVIDRIAEVADQLREQAAEAEKNGRLTDQTVKAMKTAGLIRLLQPAKHGGYQAHPREFAETVMATAALDPATGWIRGAYIPLVGKFAVPAIFAA